MAPSVCIPIIIFNIYFESVWDIMMNTCVYFSMLDVSINKIKCPAKGFQ